MAVSGRVPVGLARWYCNRCRTAIVDTFRKAQVTCPRGHKCSLTPTAKTREAL